MHMSDDTKKKIKERYQLALYHGEFFWPDSIFKDVIVSLAIFVLLILLAVFLGVPIEPKADPSDTSYVPRPEWYFLFLFKFLALYGQIPWLGKIEWIATVVVPGAAVLVLVLLPFIEHGPNRHYSRRILPISLMALLVVDVILLTFMADVPTVAADGSLFIGILQAIAGLVVPGVAIVLLFLFSFVFKNIPARVMIWTTGLAAVLMLGFAGTALAVAPKPASTEATVAVTLTDQIQAGQDLYSVNCVECHGDDGKVTEIKGVEGLEGKIISPVNGRDVLYTLNDAALAEVIAYGRPDAGMNPFGKTYNPEGLTKSEINYIVTFMRYAWDDRFESPPLKPLFPPLAANEVPSYDVHIAPIVTRYCISCHRAGKENNNYLMTSYEEILTTGDQADRNIIAGDENSYLLQVIQKHEISDTGGKVIIGVMPPSSTLKPNVVEVFVRWIMAGMPQTAEDAAKITIPPAPAP